MVGFNARELGFLSKRNNSNDKQHHTRSNLVYNWLGDSQQEMRQAVGAYSAYHTRALADVCARVVCFFDFSTFRLP